MANSDVSLTLRESVDELLTLLTGLDLTYETGADRFHTLARTLNRALRSVALEHEWSYYSGLEEIGTTSVGLTSFDFGSRLRVRKVNDDAAHFIDPQGKIQMWAYFLPRDSLHKYQSRDGLWATVTRTTMTFSRPIRLNEAGLRCMIPVMREPRMFELPPAGTEFEERVLGQLLDFDYPDLVIARAAYFYAQTDPVMQSRVQTLEAQYKDAMYQLIERDEQHTDTPYQNEFTVPIQNSIFGSGFGWPRHGHPHSDERWM